MDSRPETGAGASSSRGILSPCLGHRHVHAAWSWAEVGRHSDPAWSTRSRSDQRGRTTCSLMHGHCIRAPRASSANTRNPPVAPGRRRDATSATVSLADERASSHDEELTPSEARWSSPRCAPRSLPRTPPSPCHPLCSVRRQKAQWLTKKRDAQPRAGTEGAR